MRRRQVRFELVLPSPAPVLPMRAPRTATVSPPAPAALASASADSAQQRTSRRRLCRQRALRLPSSGCVVAKHECDVEVECDDLASCTQERCVGNRCTSTADDTRCGTTVCNPASKTADQKLGMHRGTLQQRQLHAGPLRARELRRRRPVPPPDDLPDQREQCCAGVCALSCDNPRACVGRPQGHVCRVAVGTCDIPEVCDGVNDACPADLRAPNTFECRPKAGDCDVAEAATASRAFVRPISSCPLERSAATAPTSVMRSRRAPASRAPAPSMSTNHKEYRAALLLVPATPSRPAPAPRPPALVTAFTTAAQSVAPRLDRATPPRPAPAPVSLVLPMACSMRSLCVAPQPVFATYPTRARGATWLSCRR